MNQPPDKPEKSPVKIKIAGFALVLIAVFGDFIVAPAFADYFNRRGFPVNTAGSLIFNYSLPSLLATVTFFWLILKKKPREKDLSVLAGLALLIAGCYIAGVLIPLMW